MTYTVYYKKVGSLFWSKLKRVKGDGLIDESSVQRTSNNSRWFILADESRVEIPTANIIFKFSRDRFYSIKSQVEKETGKI